MSFCRVVGALRALKREYKLPNKQVLQTLSGGGYPKVSDFKLQSSFCYLDVLQKHDLAVLLKNLYFSCEVHNKKDPGVPMGYGVAEVEDSSHPNFKKGDLVWGWTGLEEYTMVKNAERLLKITCHNVPSSHYLGVLGAPGISAYAGFYNLCSPKCGETVYVSSAAGAVGQLVGQFAKMAGCYVVGSASTKKQVDLAKSKFGFDDIFNCKEEQDLSAALKRYFPKGIDIYFDNIGSGAMLDKVLLHMKPHGRIACGMKYPHIDNFYEQGVKNLSNVVTKRLEIKGFVERDFKALYPEYLELAIKFLLEKKLVYVQDVAEGLEKAPSALVGVFHGRNVGQQIIHIADKDVKS